MMTPTKEATPSTRERLANMLVAFGKDTFKNASIPMVHGKHRTLSSLAAGGVGAGTELMDEHDKEAAARTADQDRIDKLLGAYATLQLSSDRNLDQAGYHKGQLKLGQNRLDQWNPLVKLIPALIGANKDGAEGPMSNSDIRNLITMMSATGNGTANSSMLGGGADDGSDDSGE
jgi:hypothetical protein